MDIRVDIRVDIRADIGAMDIGTRFNMDICGCMDNATRKSEWIIRHPKRCHRGNQEPNHCCMDKSTGSVTRCLI